MTDIATTKEGSAQAPVGVAGVMIDDLTSLVHGLQVERKRSDGAYQKVKSDYLGGIAKWSRKNAALHNLVTAQRAVIGLLVACIKGDEGADATFALYAAREVTGELRHEARELKRRQRLEAVAAKAGRTVEEHEAWVKQGIADRAAAA